MSRMTPEAIEAFVRTPNLHAIVGTIRRDGAPQLSPVWYLYEDGKILFNIPVGSAKHRNMERDPRISVCVDGGRADVRTVIFYGTAELRPSDEELGYRIVRAYYPTDEDARAYYDSIEGQETRLVVLAPERIVSQDYND